MEVKELREKQLTFVNDLVMVEMNYQFEHFIRQKFYPLFVKPQSITSEEVNALRDEIIQLANKLDVAVKDILPRTINPIWQSYLPAVSPSTPK